MNNFLNVILWFGTFVSIASGNIGLWILTRSLSKDVQKWKRIALLLGVIVMFLFAYILASLPAKINTTQNTITPTNPIPIQIAAALTATATAHAQGIYEAEAIPPNTIDGGAYVEMCPRCSNGRVVFNIGHAPNRPPGTLQFNNVYAAKDGSYWMLVTYCGYYSFDNYAYVSVNAEPAFKVHYLPAGDCLDKNAKLGNLFVSVSLHQGNNTIKFSNPYDYSSYIDKITIQPINP